MRNNSLFDRCRVNTNIDNDVFVGLQRKDGVYEIKFPLGYHLGNEEKELRKDILLLINVLSQNTEKKESEIYNGIDVNDYTGIPVQSYLYLIKDYFERGYYKETNSSSYISKRGKIDWSKTIKTQKPFLQDNEAYYLDFVVKKNLINENELISLVHKFCVYESFDKFGWLFTSFVPAKPQVKLNRKMMISVVNRKIQNTYNDANKQLFNNMLAVLKNYDDDKSDFMFGTYRFEYVWEKMIDRVFGVPNKDLYFPKTIWNLYDGKKYDNAPLEPDSIMIINNKIYVLDAKYYKYGWSGNPGHLPETTSINKQITYGEYIAENERYMKSGKHPTVYNAFIMPFDSFGKTFNTGKPLHYIGSATSTWKTGKRKYENVLGILLDIKYLMNLHSRLDINEMLKLAEIIEKNCPV